MKKKVVEFTKLFGPSIAAFALPLLASAQTGELPGGYQGSAVPQSNIVDANGVLSLLCQVFTWAFYILIILAVIFVLVAAFRYLTAAGDPEKVKGAGNTLLYAAVAIGVALLARAVPLIIGSFIGTNGPVLSC